MRHSIAKTMEKEKEERKKLIQVDSGAVFKQTLVYTTPQCLGADVVVVDGASERAGVPLATSGSIISRGLFLI